MKKQMKLKIHIDVFPPIEDADRYKAVVDFEYLDPEDRQKKDPEEVTKLMFDKSVDIEKTLCVRDCISLFNCIKIYLEHEKFGQEILWLNVSLGKVMLNGEPETVIKDFISNSNEADLNKFLNYKKISDTGRRIDAEVSDGSKLTFYFQTELFY
jgi:hypothetical protein